MSKKRKSTFEHLGSISASTTHSVHRSDGRNKDTLSLNKNKPKVNEIQEILTKGYLQRLNKKLRERRENDRSEKD